MVADIPSNSTEFLFGENSTSIRSQLIMIPINKCMVLKAFGLTSIEGAPAKDDTLKPRVKQMVTVLQSAVDPNIDSVRKLEQECGCSNDVVRLPVDIVPIVETCVRQCGAWVLHENQNVGIIAVPGYYRLIMSDESMPGHIIVTATMLDREYCANLPRDLFFGNVG